LQLVPADLDPSRGAADLHVLWLPSLHPLSSSFRTRSFKEIASSPPRRIHPTPLMLNQPNRKASPILESMERGNCGGSSRLKPQRFVPHLSGPDPCHSDGGAAAQQLGSTSLTSTTDLSQNIILPRSQLAQTQLWEEKRPKRRSLRARTQCARRTQWGNGFQTSTRAELASSMLEDSMKETICGRKYYSKVCELSAKLITWQIG
jgi:hypothetical protein